jgi:hypothetical protein
LISFMAAFEVGMETCQHTLILGHCSDGMMRLTVSTICSERGLHPRKQKEF